MPNCKNKKISALLTSTLGKFPQLIVVVTHRDKIAGCIGGAVMKTIPRCNQPTSVITYRYHDVRLFDSGSIFLIKLLRNTVDTARGQRQTRI